MVPPGVNAGEEMARVAMASRNSRRNIVGSECMLKGPRGSSRARPVAFGAALPLAIASLAACTGERPVPATSAGDWIVGATPIFTIGATEAGPGQELAQVSGARWAGGRRVRAPGLRFGRNVSGRGGAEGTGPGRIPRGDLPRSRRRGLALYFRRREPPLVAPRRGRALRPGAPGRRVRPAPARVAL